MELKLGSHREVRLVSLGLALALVVVGLLALTEKGPVAPAVPVGPSPLNPLSLGTLSFYEMARERYRTLTVTKIEELGALSASKCLFVVVSPEVPVGDGEAAAVARYLRSGCGEVALLVADEETTSNNLLKAFNSTVRVVGNRVGTASNGTISFYPSAVIALAGREHRVVLDLASEVTGGSCVGYVPGSVVVQPPLGIGQNSTVLKSGVCIASEETAGGAHIVVLGDGSILLNQVLNSGRAAYRDLASDLLNYMCGSGDCLVILDAIHYRSENPLHFLSSRGGAQSLGASLMDLLYMSLAAALALLHPSFWLPPAFRLCDEFVGAALYSAIAYLAIPIVSAYITHFLTSPDRYLRDEPMAEQTERDVLIAADLRSSIERGSVKLGPKDFANLYSMVSMIATSVLGVGLGDESFPKLLGRYIGDQQATSYWKFMNSTYRRATGASRWPLLVLWGRTTRKALMRSEEVLSALGASLEEGVGIERLATTVGGSIGGPSS
jgi:hypothetical protein